MERDYAEMLSALCDENAEFLVVGAHAMAAHGLPRATGALDLWLRADKANSERVWRALNRFGAPMGDLTLEDLQRPGVVYQIGVAPCRIDLLTSIEGVSFASAWPRRKSIRVGERAVAVIGADDLLANKRATGRAKDMVDVEWLEQRIAGDA
ncbi:MAG: hypothetical protein HZA52_09355 [Planctomycetes bacterium]|nr:hypothetical protein [Planctomycetota bacterium]